LLDPCRAVRSDGGVREFSLPRCDEPPDFRRQALTYARYRRDYSDALYDAIEVRAGAGGGRAALDLGCGTGFVAATLARRGWRPVGVDFSAPMLAEARRLGAGDFMLARAAAEALPLRDASVALVTCGTAFHWFAPMPTLAEVVRVLAPGGWAALFWRYDAPSQPHMKLVGELLREIASDLPVLGDGFTVHPPEPFAGSTLVAAPARIMDGELAFTAESFHGYVGTLEWIRRFSGDRYGEFLERLGEETRSRWPDGFRARVIEYLYLARRPA
jgi:ubiquinone/menaquinone biosynthesis C-methylase UbiE